MPDKLRPYLRSVHAMGSASDNLMHQEPRNRHKCGSNMFQPNERIPKCSGGA